MNMRIVVVGTSACGKTTLAKRLAKQLNCKAFDLDDLYWLPNWVMRPDEEVLSEIEEIAEGDHWVISGNYKISQDITWPVADLIIWIDLPLYKLLYRGVKRTLTNIWYRRPLCNGNFNTLGRLFSKNSIIAWIITSYSRRKRRYEKLFSNKEDPKHIRVSNQSEIKTLISAICEGSSDLI
jgi:adenylate kinase family enzyme